MSKNDKWDGLTATEVMAAKVDHIYDRMRLIEDLLADLSPGFGKIAKETGPAIKGLREVYERDETLALVKKAGEEIPTFLDLLKLMEAVRGLIDDLMPSLGRIDKEISPTVKSLREVYERDETIELVRKAGENIPAFLEFLRMMEVAKGLVNDLQPAVGKISKEIMPAINTLRNALEKDESLDLLQKLGENVTAFNKLLDSLNKLDARGTLDYTLERFSGDEMDVMLRGIQSAAANTMKQFLAAPPSPGVGSLFKSIRDPEVQKGLLFLTSFAKNLTAAVSKESQQTRGK